LPRLDDADVLGAGIAVVAIGVLETAGLVALANARTLDADIVLGTFVAVIAGEAVKLLMAAAAVDTLIHGTWIAIVAIEGLTRQAVASLTGVTHSARISVIART